MRHGTVRCLAWLMAALLVRCGPAVKPVDIRLSGASFANSDEAVAELAIANPNGFALDLLGAEYRVSLGGSVCGSGQRDEPLHIGGRDSMVAEFPLKIDYISLAKSLPLLFKDSAACKVEGNYTVNTVIGRRRLTFKTERRIAVKQEIGSILDQLFRNDK